MPNRTILKVEIFGAQQGGGEGLSGNPEIEIFASEKPYLKVCHFLGLILRPYKVINLLEIFSFTVTVTFIIIKVNSRP